MSNVCEIAVNTKDTIPNHIELNRWFLKTQVLVFPGTHKTPGLDKKNSKIQGISGFPEILLL